MKINPAQKQSDTLVFTVAMNGYQWLYQRFINSHQRYADKYGFDYYAVTRPAFTLLGVECCWLKLVIIQRALLAGYQHVLFVDADAKIQPLAPNIISEVTAEHAIYLARGCSGKLNSGVILAKNCDESLQWLKRVLSLYSSALHCTRHAGWGENDAVIHCGEGFNGLGELDQCWNNTSNPNLVDYIRHFSHGPLRNQLHLFAIHRLLNRLTRLIQRYAQTNESPLSLSRLANKALKRAPYNLNQPDIMQW